ncbi:MAG: hypothetical protein ACYSVY_23440 [Planctomycetota bacterium]|jgi:hypothetical protein
MAKTRIDADKLRRFLWEEKIATLEELKSALGTTGTMTVFRKLKTLGYLSSYSHRGKYYTLHEIPDFDEQGLWNWHAVWFSKYGNLVKTAREFVEEAESGLSARELESILHVECKRALLKLYRERQVARAKIAGLYVYLCNDKGKQRSQKLQRRDSAAAADAIGPQVTALSHELSAAIILFFSLLDERQRRLYAGLESQKFGHGGDRKIAELLGLDPHTVAKGRRELFSGEVDRERIRHKGGGRKRVEKKRPPSSKKSNV